MKLHITTIAALGLALISATTNAQEHNIKYLGDHIYLQTEVNGKPATSSSIQEPNLYTSTVPMSPTRTSTSNS